MHQLASYEQWPAAHGDMITRDATIKYLPQMSDETKRRYLFVAIDRATRWVYFRVYANQTEVSSTDFLRRLKKVAPMKMQTILTDNGTQFTDRFTSQGKRASGKHVFDVSCAEMGIAHRLSPPANEWHG